MSKTRKYHGLRGDIRPDAPALITMPYNVEDVKDIAPQVAALFPEEEVNVEITTQMSATPFDACMGEPPMAAFIRPGDKLPAYIAYLMYSDRPPNLYGYVLMQDTTHIAVYVAGSNAIVGFRGTSVGQEGGAQDIFDDIEIAFGEGCQLSIAQQGLRIVEDLARQGFNITLAGHSLGGRAAICLGRVPGVVNVVALNAGAPAINPEYADGVVGTHYHIIGDFISTHVMGMPTVRVVMRGGEQTNWLDPWFHSADRFLGNDDYELAGPNYEQADLEDFLYNRGRAQLTALNAATSLLAFSWYQKAKRDICETPIDGATIKAPCYVGEKVGTNTILQVAAGAVGAIIGMLAGPGGAVSGYFIGQGIVDGDVSGVLNAIVPGFTFVRGIVRDGIVDIVKNSTGPKDMVEKLAKYETKLQEGE